MATIRQKLSNLGFEPEQGLISRQSVSVKENGQKYQLKFSNRQLSCVYSVDGYIIRDGFRCDKLLLVEHSDNECREIFVELKGKEIPHAIEQLRATLSNGAFLHSSVIARHARIVGRRIPANTGNSVLERARQEFIRKFNCDLRAMASGTIDAIKGL